MRVTIRDVAQRLNLSITTVSRALDGYSDVAEHTRQEVVRVAHEMGYVPNQAARQLRRQHSDTLGYVLPASLPRFNEPFYTEFVAGLGDQSSRRGFDLLISSVTPGAERENEIYRHWVQSRRVDGMILNRMRIEDWRVSYMTQEKFPFVGLESSDFVSPQALCGFIEVDSRNAFCELVEHLAGNGHRRIAYIGGAEEFKIHHQRLQGYKDGLEAVGLTFDPGLVGLGSFESDGGYAHAHALLTMPDPPSAILCINDMTALGALQAAQDLGVKVGENLALSGFDGSDFTRHTRPSLTTIRQPLYDMACQLVDMLIQLVNGVPLVEPVVHLKPEIILRESTSFVL